MVRVPLPQEPLRPTARNGVFTAPGVLSPAGAQAAQIENLGEALTVSGLRVARAAGELEESIHVGNVKEAQARAEEVILNDDLVFTKRKGKDAIDAFEPAWEGLQKQLETVSEGLEPSERPVFNRVLVPRMLDVRARWTKHYDDQVIVREVGASEALLQGRIDTAIRNLPPAGRPTTATGQAQAAGALQLPVTESGAGMPSHSLLPVRAEATTLARLRGLDGPERDRFIQEKLTEVHVGRVESLADSGRGSEAKTYLAGVEGELTASGLARLQGVVRRASVQEESFDLAVTIRNKAVEEYHRTIQQSLGPTSSLADQVAVLDREMPAGAMLTEGLARVQSMQEQGLAPEVADGVRAQLIRMANERAEVEAQEVIGVRNQAQQILREGAPSGVELLPPSLYREAERMGLLDELRDYAGGKGRTSDPAAWFRAESLSDEALRRLSPAQLAREFGGLLSPQHLSELAARQRRALGEQQADDESILNPSERVRMTLVRDPSGELWPVVGQPTERQVLDRMRIEEEVQKRVSDEKLHNRPSTGEALQKIIDGVMLDRATLPGGWLSSDVIRPTAAFTPEELLRAVRPVGEETLPVIPPTLGLRIFQGLKDRGLPTTPEEIVRVFRELEREQRRGQQ